DSVWNSVIAPAVVMRPILLLLLSANQRFPSGPAVIPNVREPPVGMEKFPVTLCAAAAPAKTAKALTSNRANSAPLCLARLSPDIDAISARRFPDKHHPGRSANTRKNSELPL